MGSNDRESGFKLSLKQDNVLSVQEIHERWEKRRKRKMYLIGILLVFLVVKLVIGLLK